MEGCNVEGGRLCFELDIAKYFDTLDHRQLRDSLTKRVRDGVIRKAIDSG